MALIISFKRMLAFHCTVAALLIATGGIFHAVDKAAATATMTELILMLEHDESGYQAAAKLGAMNESAVPLLIPALSSPNANTRKWSARALTNMVGGHGETKGRPATMEAGPALVAATAAEQDVSVLWYQLQAIGRVLPPPELALPLLQRLFTHADNTVREQALESCGEYGGAAQPALETLIALLASGGENVDAAANAIFRIDSSPSTLERLLQLNLPDAVIAKTEIVANMLRTPALATKWLPRYPQALASLHPFLSGSFMPLFQAQDAEHRTLRAHLVTRSDLPNLWIALLEDHSLAKTLYQRQAKADKHQRTYLAACLRALGEPVGPVIEIAPSEPGDFRPTSAVPGTEPARMGSGGGHGDGFACVLVTGTIRRSDGSIPRQVRFFDTNDRMLMGQELRTEAPLIYHSETGRFIFSTTVFAAYSMSDDASEPGPYQTGSAKTLIVADQSHPLTVTFYDEMPEVAISLTAGEPHADLDPVLPENPVITVPNPSMP